MISILGGLCPYCLKPLDKNGDCSIPCAPGKLKRDLRLKQAAINRNKGKTSDHTGKKD